jgi:hypothetical protein
MSIVPAQVFCRRCWGGMHRILRYLNRYRAWRDTHMYCRVSTSNQLSEVVPSDVDRGDGPWRDVELTVMSRWNSRVAMQLSSVDT